MLLVAITCCVCFALKALKLPVFIDFINIQWIIFMNYIIVYHFIYIYIIRSAIYVFSVKKGGGGQRI